MLPFTVLNMCLITLSHKHRVRKTAWSESDSADYGTLGCKAVYFLNRYESSTFGNKPKGVNEIFHLRNLTIYPVDILLPAKRHLIQNLMCGIRFPPMRSALFCDAAQRRSVELVRNLMAHAQKPVFVFRLNGRVHLNRRGSQFNRLLAAEVCASALVMLDTLRSEVVWEYWLPTPFASFPFTSPPVRHRVPSHFNWSLQVS